MSKNETIERTEQKSEPLHWIAEHAVTLLAKNQGPMNKDEADELKDAIASVPDEALGEALFSLQRVAGYFHERLGSAAVAAQLMDLCFNMTHQLVAATDRMNEKREARDRSRQRVFHLMTGGDGSDWRGFELPRPADEGSRISVNMLRPKTRFR